jgi:hypothetical protein
VSNSKYAVPMIVSSQLKLGKKKKFRLAPNYIPINDKIKRKQYPTVNIKEMTNRVTGRFKAKIDIKSAHNTIPLMKEDWHKTAFVTQHIPGLGDHFEFTCATWGFNNIGGFFQLTIENILRSNEVFERNLKGDCCEVIQYDIIIHAYTLEQLFIDTKEVLDRLFYYGLTPSWEKCEFAKEEITFCGFIITPQGLMQDPHMIEALNKVAEPANRDFV